ncbi:hypothetical protein ACIBBE_47660 [Streptomyces sp. NPDC051644]|uniref:hypothetical protein n=1 Tax=Streptomyces sp. NPDC051644 TaxID=3365666 RepID=UPI0037A6CBB7
MGGGAAAQEFAELGEQASDPAVRSAQLRRDLGGIHAQAVQCSTVHCSSPKSAALGVADVSDPGEQRARDIPLGPHPLGRNVT